MSKPLLILMIGALYVLLIGVQALVLYVRKELRGASWLNYFASISIAALGGMAITTIVIGK